MSYNSEAKTLLRSYKELGESELAEVMAKSMAPLLGCFEDTNVVFVPIPSNRSSMRERGFNPAELLARELSLTAPNLTWKNLLVRSKETKDQSKLSPSERRENQRDSMSAQLAQERLVLIDDVVTTGSTLLSANKALTVAGNSVLGFITFAETETKRCNLTTQAQLPADGGTSWN